MIEVFDRSGRRGVLVPMLKKIHELIATNALRDTAAGLPPPDNYIIWSHKMRKQLVDIKWRFLVAMDGATIAGLMFYRYLDTAIYIEELQIAWAYRKNPQVIEGLLRKLEFDPGTKVAVFYANDRMKLEPDKEILASVGFRDEHEGGWECLGSFADAVNAIKLRYNR